MAKHKTPFPFRGRIGDLLFYITADGQQRMQRVGGPTAQRMRRAPEFVRSRENASEFGTAAKAIKAIRHGFEPFALRLGVGNQARLLGPMIAVLAADGVSRRGARQPTQAGLAALRGFEWNRKFAVGAGLSPAVTQTPGGISVSVPAAAPLLARGGVLTLAVVGFGPDGRQPVATHELRAVLPGAGAVLACALPAMPLWVAGIGIAGPEGGGMVLL